jgi:hypothetical protein
MDGSKVNYRRLLLAPAATLAALFLSASAAWAGNKTWTGTTGTTWSTGANWTPAGAPGTIDRAIIPNVANKPIVTANTTIDQLVVDPGATVTINTNITLTIDGGTSPIIDGTGTVLTVGTGLLSVTDGPLNGVLINDTMTLGNFRLSPASGRSLAVSSGKTVTFNGTLTVNQGSFQVGTLIGPPVVVDLNGSLVINANSTVLMRSDDSILRVSGNWTQAGIFNPGTRSTVIMDGTAAQTFTVSNNQAANVQFDNLRISTTGGACTYAPNASLATGFVVLDNFTLDAGTTTVIQEPAVIGTTSGDTLGIGSGATLTFTQRFDPDCTIAFDIDAGAQNGTLVLQGTQLPPSDTSDFGFALRAGHGTVRIQVTANQPFALTNGGPYSFWDLAIQTDTGAGQVDADIITTTAAFTVLHDLYLTRCQFQVAAVTIDIFGGIISGPSTQSQLDFTGAGTLQVRGNVDLGSVSQVASGVAGPFATIFMNGTTPQTFQIHATTASQYFDIDALHIGNPAGVTVLDNPNGNFVVNGQILIDANAKLICQDVFDPQNPLVFAAGGGNVLRLENIIAPDTSPIGTTFTPGTGTVIYAGQGINQIVYTQQNSGAQIQYYNLTIDNNGGAVATQDVVNSLRVNGTFMILGAASSFTSFANGMTVSKDFIVNGTFTHANGTVTLNGTGFISGSAPSLTFYNLVVDGATTDLVTVSRNFTTANNFQVNQGHLTTQAFVAVTMTANLGATVGNGAGAAGSSSLDLLGPATLLVAAGRTFSVNGTDGRFTALANVNGTPTLSHSGAGTFTATVGGQANLYGLNFSFGDVAGLSFTATSTLERLRNVRFTNASAVANSRHLTIAAANLNLDCPGCWFDATGTFNVQARGANSGMRLRFENRGTVDAPAGQGIGGPGAGDARDNDDDLAPNENGVLTDAGETATGSLVQWVYTANIDMIGTIEGAPTPAFDWNTFNYYATYVVMNRASLPPDTIYVLDANGDVRPGHSFQLSPFAARISGSIFWDTEGTTHVIYFGTTTGAVYKLIDNGATLATPALPDPWFTPYIDPSLQYVSTSIMSDQTNLYFGGNDNINPASGNWKIYRVSIAAKTQLVGAINLGSAAVTSDSSWGDTAVGRMIFQASGTTTGGASAIYRIRTASWTIDAQVNSTSAFTGPTNVPLDTLFAGEANGRVHAVNALGLSSQFIERTGFPFTVNVSPITGGIIWDNTNAARLPALTGGRLFFGTNAGAIHSLYLYPATWTLGTNYYRVTPAGGAPVQSVPLCQDGILYVSSNNGRLYVLDADGGAGPALMTTYTLFGNAATGDLSRDSIGSGRIYIGTTAGRVYSITPPSDPTPAVP